VIMSVTPSAERSVSSSLRQSISRSVSQTPNHSAQSGRPPSGSFISLSTGSKLTSVTNPFSLHSSFFPLG
jgi:hypothetical protein